MSDFVQRSKVRKIVYGLFLLAGVATAGFLYLVAFNRLSESALMRLVPAWVMPLLIGVYGLIGEDLMMWLERDRAPNLAAAASEWNNARGPARLVMAVLLLPFLPFRFLKWQNSWLAVVFACLLWGLPTVLLLGMMT